MNKSIYPKGLVRGLRIQNSLPSESKINCKVVAVENNSIKTNFVCMDVFPVLGRQIPIIQPVPVVFEEIMVGGKGSTKNYIHCLS